MPDDRGPKQGKPTPQEIRGEISFGPNERHSDPMPIMKVMLGSYVVGTISLKYIDGGKICEIIEIALLDSHRDKGLGGAILKKLNSDAKAKGMVVVSAENEPLTPDGRKMFERLVTSGEAEYLPPDKYGRRYKLK